MFNDYVSLLKLEELFKKVYNYEFTNYDELLKQDFISFEGNGVTSKFWFAFQGEEYLFKEMDEAGVLGELLSFKLTKIMNIPCADYRACTINGSLGVITKKVYRKDETLVLGAQIIQEYLNKMFPGKNIFDLLQDKSFREQYSIPDNILDIAPKIRLKYLFNDFNNLEQLWRISYNYFDKNTSNIHMLMNYLIETFLFDIFTIQRDRHIENWGIIKNANNLYRVSPLYDNAMGFGLTHDTTRRINKVLNNRHLIGEDNEYEFREIFYSKSALLGCLEDDNKHQRNNIEMLKRFLEISDSCYVDMFYYFKEELSKVDILKLVQEIEEENGLIFSARLKEYISFVYYKNLEYIDEMLLNNGFRRV